MPPYLSVLSTQSPAWLHNQCAQGGVCDAASVGQEGPPRAPGPGLESMLGRHGSWLCQGAFQAGQGEILFLPTFPKTWHLLSVQAWEGLGGQLRHVSFKSESPG